MNIHLKEESFIEMLKDSTLISVKVGSHLYGLNNQDSDTDILNLYAQGIKNKSSFLWTHHQFQVKKDNTDYLYSTLNNFLRNLLSGDSTINYEVIFSEEIKKDKDLSFLYDFRNNFKSYQLLKSYLGIARRDLKQYHKEKLDKKLMHCLRGVWSFEQIKQDSYSNDIKTNDIKTFNLLQNIKNGTCLTKEELAKELFLKIESYREELNNSFQKEKSLSRMMEPAKMKELDNWLMDFCNSDRYKILQKTALDIDLQAYSSLQDDINYGDNK